MNAIERLVEQWRYGNVKVLPPASSSELLALENALAAPLPTDVAAFYKLMNGMEDFEYDAHQISLWSIPKILTEGERRSGTDAIGPFNDLAIADFLINSWFLYLRVRNGTVTVLIGGAEEEVKSLSVFSARYVEAPNSLPVI